MAKCYNCIHRGTSPGSAHSSCNHPDIDDKFEELLRMLQGKGSVASKLRITAEEHGVVSGWFNWPLDFDPVWLKTCDGFKEKVT